MLNILIPLHEMVLGGAITQNEQAFVKTFGRELEKGRKRREKEKEKQKRRKE